MSIETGIWFFFIYALFGYIVEVIYCSIGEKRVVNRGFLHGPYLPIYGFGALLILICFSSLYDRPLLLFVCSMVATTALEYLTSFILEQLFQSKLWDYSKRKI